MGLYVEVMCDMRLEGTAPGSELMHLCWSDRNANPQGGTVRAAKAEAKRLKWVLGAGRKAVCPGCASVPAAQRASKEGREDGV